MDDADREHYVIEAVRLRKHVDDLERRLAELAPLQKWIDLGRRLRAMDALELATTMLEPTEVIS